MNRRHTVGIGLVLSLAAAVSCGTGDGTTSPKAIDGVLLHASDLPTMRLEKKDSIADPGGFVELLGGGESCACPTVFKDDPDVVSAKLYGFGFKRGYRENWVGAGVHGAAFVAEFDTADHAKAALDYMDAELFRECIDEPYCSRRDRIKNPEIPDFVGLAITPLRPKHEGREATFYKFLFRIGTIVYGAMDGADNAYDPGSVSKAQALAVVQRLYDRVKEREISDVLRSAPPSPFESGIAKDVGRMRDAIRLVPASSIKSPAEGTRTDMLSILDDVVKLASTGNGTEALQKLQSLLGRLDGCGAKADNNDWILNCPDQVRIRALIQEFIDAGSS